MPNPMKAGDKIRVFDRYGHEDYIVEEFRFCLGIFKSADHRKAADFTPLCEMYERGPDSETDYISNWGSYFTNEVQAWADLPAPPGEPS